MGWMLFCGGLSVAVAQEPLPQAPWYWNLQVPSLGLKAAPPAGPKALEMVPVRTYGAVVEVWGEHPEETLRLFRKRLLPELAVAFEMGLSSGTSRQMLSEFMAMGADVHAPSTPSVFYNAYRPTELDPKLLMFTGVSKSWVTVTAGASKR
jgi:hypothetical protein